MYRTMSEYLSSWRSEQEPNFEQFRIVAAERDGRVVQLRDVMARFSMPFGFYPGERARPGDVCLTRRGWTLRDSR